MAPSSSVLSLKTAVALLFGFAGTWWLFVHTSSIGYWRYEFPRDASNYGLSSQQRDAAFPGFYGDIESAVTSRERVPIRLEELEIKDDQCLVRVLIYDSEVGNRHIIDVYSAHVSNYELAAFHSSRSPEQEVLDGTLARTNERFPTHDSPSHHHRTTRLSTQHRVHTRHDPQRPIEFAHGKDSNKTTVWGLTRLAHQRHIWLFPDYAYWAWPSARVASHAQVRRNVHEVNIAYPWEKKYNKAVWRGDANLNKDVRKKLISTAKDTAWGDVRVCDIYDPKTKQHCMTQDQLCRYRYPIHTEGYTYSGRLKYLQLCNSAPVVHKLRYLEHHHGLMRSSGPEQNFIEVEKDWSDLDEKVKLILHILEESLILTTTLYTDDILHHTRERGSEDSRQQLQNFPGTILDFSSNSVLLATLVLSMGQCPRVRSTTVREE
jgi:protein glucosyltransferase